MKMLDENGLSEEIRSIIENTNDLMFVKNRDFVYIASSKSFATNCVRCNGVEDVIGKTDFELFDDPAVAAKYRKDDEKLFASGESMAEFQEEYLGIDGEKHFCLTAKYVLHDEDGNPAGIFAQYHDIGSQVEAEIARRRDINKNVAKALSKAFFAANYVDLITHKYVAIRAMEYIRKMVEGCDTIEQAFEAFIQTLVKPAYQDKMREFCQSDTIAERLRGKKQIDCEYLSNVAIGWCKASFFPCEWDENNEVTHALFAVSPIDENIAQEIEEGINSKESLNAIFDEVPGGIVLYEWNGKELKVLQMSKYYRELYGDSMLNDTNSPDFVRIHPDDVDDYQKAIGEALTKTHHLEYVFRAWTPKLEQYVWTQIYAISKPQEDGTSLVYAIYSDVSEQKEAELEAAKKQASLEAALQASNQLCCEYDPEAHVLHCFTEENFFHLPAPMHHYPECLREIDLFHPDDLEAFIQTVHSTDNGTQSAHCDVRAKRDGKYRWYACRFEPYFDEEKGRNVIILTIVDATMRVDSIQSYKDRLHAVEKSNEDALCMCDVNLTKNQFSNVQANGIIKKCRESAGTLDEFMMLASEAVFDPEEQQEYRDIFQHEKLLKRFEQGETHIKFEHFYRISDTNTALVATIFDLIKEPVKGEIVGICYAKDLNESKMSNILLNDALDRDYPMAAFVYADTGEYYLYEVDGTEYCSHKQDYWGAVYRRLADSVEGEKLERIRNDMTREKVVGLLKDRDEFAYSFYGTYRGKRCRLEAKFRYIDRKHNLLIATLRNITDETLYRQYKHDSEHDPLTGLYNRDTLFIKCRELLDTYPEEQFIMVHLDVKHFHLYNTFFGDEAGNQLLCEMAKVLSRMGGEYDYFAHGRIQADVFCAFFPTDRGLFEGHVRGSFKELESFSPDFPLELAIGAYWVTDPSMSIEAMFSRATIAAKSHKKNLFDLISRFDESMEQELKDAQQITSEMTAAIEQEQFEVYLQPKYSLRSEKMTGAEALVRWIHPERGMISPGVFIPAFEKNGFIAELDRYMWEHVCQILRRWQDEGKPMYPVSVNISRVSMYSHATVPFIKSLVKKYDIDPVYLELELTETAYMDDPEDLKRMLKELQEAGFKILMDDFGSGYSSLNTLRDLPVDVLKLDMKFLSKTENDNRGLAVLSSVVRMSKLLDLPIVAEGVEQKEQADYLRSIGCEYVQGFLYARPMPVNDYENQLDAVSVKNKKDTLPKKDQISIAAANAVVEEGFTSIGILEYENDRFAYLRTNRSFLKDFDLIENLNPASKVFYEHMDDKNYKILLQSFAFCANTKKDAMCLFEWISEDGSVRKYHGYVHYLGNVGNYADLSATFMNVTEVSTFGMDE